MPRKRKPIAGFGDAKGEPEQKETGLHTASLGLAWSGGTALPQAFAQGMFVGQHGSSNRRPHSGYKAVFVPFRNGQPSGLPVDVLTGFLSADSEAHGRPVGVAMDKHGGLLVADDMGKKSGGSVPRREARHTSRPCARPLTSKRNEQVFAKLAASYAAIVVVMVLLDVLWLGWVAKPMYQQGLAHL